MGASPAFALPDLHGDSGKHEVPGKRMRSSLLSSLSWYCAVLVIISERMQPEDQRSTELLYYLDVKIISGGRYQRDTT